MRWSNILLLLVLVTIAAGGCKRLKTGAREEFGKKYSCPEDRVEVLPRDDLKYGDLILSGAAKKTPPDEVLKDPGRLAKWQSDNDAENEELRETLNELEVFETKGCDHVAFLGCSHPEDSEGVATDIVNCFEIPPGRVPK